MYANSKLKQHCEIGFNKENVHKLSYIHNEKDEYNYLIFFKETHSLNIDEI